MELSDIISMHNEESEDLLLIEDNGLFNESLPESRCIVVKHSQTGEYWMILEARNYYLDYDYLPGHGSNKPPPCIKTLSAYRVEPKEVTVTKIEWIPVK